MFFSFFKFVSVFIREFGVKVIFLWSVIGVVLWLILRVSKVIKICVGNVGVVLYEKFKMIESVGEIVFL